MAPRQRANKAKSVPIKPIIKRRTSDKAKIQQLIKDQPNWWDMKVSDWMPLVMSLLKLKKKPQRNDPEYKIAHNLIDNEKRRRKNEKKRNDQLAREQIRDQIDQDINLDLDDLGAAEQLEVVYGDSVEGAQPI